ncbi:MAG: FAD-dependent oxidoreductase [Terrimicrobiaceae bacterium]
MPEPSSSLHYYFPPSGSPGLQIDCDLCVYGGNSGGVIAAIAAKRRGLTVALLEPGRHLGGLTSGGLGLTDIGNKHAIGGLSREFYRRVGKAYGVEEHWRFEPHVAGNIFRDWLAEEDITCHFESALDRVEMRDGRIRSLTTENGITVTAKMFIDASYEGDLLAKAGVSFTVGRESNAQYGETWNGSQVLDKHQFNLRVDPYVVEGNPASGLLAGIDPEPHISGAGDKRVQAYNFRLCLTNRPENRIPFTEPEGYDRSRYELLARYCRAGGVLKFNKFDQLVNGKVDMNNHGAVSTDFIGMNHEFPEAGYKKREEIFQAHVQWIKGLLWFWTQDRDVPAEFQDKLVTWGWTKDEFMETGGFSPALYVREARRLVGDVVMTEHHCTGREIAPDSVGLAAYTMDSHNCRRVVVDGVVKNEGDVQVHSGPPYPISYRSIIPRRGECKNLFVPFALSASHIAFGSIRMEPVFMLLAESSVEAAALAMELAVDVQDVPYARLRERLLKNRQILDPVPDVINRQLGE